MCGRFILDAVNYETRTQLGSDYGQFEILGKGETYPTQTVPLLIAHNPATLTLQDCQWGLPLKGLGRPVINARVETIAQKPLFRNCVPAVLVAQQWLEWRTEGNRKQPYAFSTPNSPLSMAALYWPEADGPGHCAIVTQSALDEISEYHHRMPLLLNASNAEQWLAAEPQGVRASGQDFEIEPYTPPSKKSQPIQQDLF
ncbi:SOS response-associated peptidase [Paraferrimonas sedimenticola]|uniref:Abasic site processing protein n=1 Tax=Paraferrimonas sedimenticola TaxID=375674 RepID=A0AA37RXU8_9GAMM|nr:SOS response-associated peptidase family protein [Paraferrimonas sedimenticola]GLP97118.1 DUF159 family protein [Paraferrimonas sedimenticola]